MSEDLEENEFYSYECLDCGADIVSKESDADLDNCPNCIDPTIERVQNQKVKLNKYRR